MAKFYKFLTVALLMVVTGLSFTSCKDDDDKPKDGSIVGTWRYSEVVYDDNDEREVLNMVLTFNSNKTGKIVETWEYETRSASVETYSMDFTWATTTDASGNEILKVSYVSGDHDTEVFMGSESTVLWTRQFVLTGNILNIYGNDGVWVFKR